MSLTVLLTCADAEEARGIAIALVKKRLVACANIVPKIESLYWWKGSIKEGSESVLLLKTRKNLKTRVEKEIVKLHSYETPAIEFIESKASKGAKKWIEKETGRKG